MARDVLLELLQGHPQLVKLGPIHVLDGRGPPELGYGGLVEAVQLIAALFLGFELVVHLRELCVQLTHVGTAVGLDELHGPRVLRRGAREVAIYDRVHVGVAKGEDFLPWGEHNECHVSATEGAKLTGFLEQPAAALGERDLEVALIAHLLHLDLLATPALPCDGHGYGNDRERDKKK